MTYVVGIDPSLTSTGFCSLSSPEGVLATTTQTFTSSPKSPRVADRIERYLDLTDAIARAARAADPVLIAIEGYSFGSKGRGIIDRAEFGGILRWRLGSIAPLVEVAPTVVKRWATGSGNAGKAEVVSKLANRYRVHFTTSDEFDAFALALIALCYAGLVEPISKAQTEIISKLKAEG